MRIRELRILVTLAEELHFGRAAERLGMAQPQLSEIVRRLEAEAQIDIFTRRPQVRLTHGGETLVETARRVLAELEAGTRRARAVAAGRIGSVVLGFSPVAMCSDLPALVRSFAKAHPDVDLTLVEGTSRPLRNRLEQGELDVVVTREPPEGEALEGLRFAWDEINVILPEGHPAAATDPVQPAQLAEDEFSMFPRQAGPEYYARVIGWARSAGLEPNVTREIESWMAGVALVGAGLSLTFGTQLLSRIVVPGVVYRSLAAPPLDVSFWMSWMKERLSPAAARFVEHVRETRPAMRSRHGPGDRGIGASPA